MKKKPKKLPKLFPYDEIEIQWIDIVSDSRWHTDEQVKNAKPAACVYVGMFVSQDSECLRCCNHVAMCDEDKDYTVFPLGVIKDIRVLRRSGYDSSSNS